MRFIVGEPPANPAFRPEAEGWTKLREPSPWTLVAVGSGLGIPLAILAAFAWVHFIEITPVSLNLSIFGPAARQAVLVLMACVPPLGLALLIVLHELCHALAFPRWGMTRDTVIGAWPSKMLFYAGHLREVSRTRYIAVCAMPFAVLTMAPLIVGAIAGSMSLPWAALSTANALVCGGDAILLVLVDAQIPRRAVIRNQGWASWWRTT
jgi:hypothetical protein